MAKDMSLEQGLGLALKDAFQEAQAQRKRVGLPPLKPDLTVYSRGPRRGLPRLGPQTYKMTLWLKPDEYADLLRWREHIGYTAGPTGLLRQMIRDALPRKLQYSRVERIPTAQRVQLQNRNARQLKAVVG